MSSILALTHLPTFSYLAIDLMNYDLKLRFLCDFLFIFFVLFYFFLDFILLQIAINLLHAAPHIEHTDIQFTLIHRTILSHGEIRN